MSGVNKVILVGNLGKDPEVKQFQDGGLVANFTVATSEKWTDKQGQTKEETEWHKVSFGGRMAEICGDYLKKGSKVYVEGKLKTRKWQDKDGKDNYTTEVKGLVMQMLDARQNTGDAGTGRKIPSSPQPVDDFGDDSIPF